MPPTNDKHAKLKAMAPNSTHSNTGTGGHSLYFVHSKPPCHVIVPWWCTDDDGNKWYR